MTGDLFPLRADASLFVSRRLHALTLSAVPTTVTVTSQKHPDAII